MLQREHGKTLWMDFSKDLLHLKYICTWMTVAFPFSVANTASLLPVYRNSPYTEHINILSQIKSPLYFLLSWIYSFALTTESWRNTDNGEWQEKITEEKQPREMYKWWDGMSWWNHTVCKPEETPCSNFESCLDLTVHELCIKRIHNSHSFSRSSTAPLISKECTSVISNPPCFYSGQCSLERQEG